MALSPRQQRFYTDTVNLYRPNALPIGANNVVGDVTFPTTPTASAVPCHWAPRPESAGAEVPGRTNADIMLTLDVFHFGLDAPDIRDGWFIELTTAGHPEAGSWFKVQGNPKTLNWRAKRKSVLAKKSVKP